MLTAKDLYDKCPKCGSRALYDRGTLKDGRYVDMVQCPRCNKVYRRKEGEHDFDNGLPLVMPESC